MSISERFFGFFGREVTEKEMNEQVEKSKEEAKTKQEAPIVEKKEQIVEIIPKDELVGGSSIPARFKRLNKLQKGLLLLAGAIGTGVVSISTIAIISGIINIIEAKKEEELKKANMQ